MSNSRIKLYHRLFMNREIIIYIVWCKSVSPGILWGLGTSEGIIANEKIVLLGLNHHGSLSLELRHKLWGKRLGSEQG